MVVFDLADRVVLVTGGSRGIGRAIAIELARAGAAVVVGFRAQADAAGDTVVRIRDEGGDALAVPADVRRADDVDRLVTEAHRWRGRLHGVVTAAGVFRNEPIEATGPDEWADTVGTDLEGTFRVVRAAAPYLLLEPGAAVVTVSSILARRPGRAASAYRAAKAGVEQLTRTLAVELAPGIRVNGVAPGFIRTDMNRDAWSDPAFADRVARATPLGRWGEPEDIAPAVRFLLSQESEGLTGVVVPIDGGMPLR